MGKIKLILIILSLFILAGFFNQIYAEDATGSSESIREKVQEKVTKALNTPKAYIGTITDISSATLQIKKFSIEGNGKNGEILQISTNKDTSYVNITKVTKSIKLSDIAIGDFIIAMGYKNGNNVLEAKKIVVRETLKPSARISLLGKVTKAGKGILEFNNLSSNEKLTLDSKETTNVTSQIDGKSIKIKFSDIKVDDLIICVGTQEGLSFKARKIAVIVSISATASPSPKASSTPKPSPTSTVKPTPTY